MLILIPNEFIMIKSRKKRMDQPSPSTPIAHNQTKTNKIVYLQGIRIPEYITAITNELVAKRIDKGINQLLNHEYKAAQLDKKNINRDVDIYTIRLKDDDRLVLCFLKEIIEGQEQNICYVLDYIPCHQYKGSWVFNEETNFQLKLNQHFELILNADDLTRLRNQEIAAEEEETKEEANNNQVELVKEYQKVHNGKLITLNFEQEQAYNQSLPKIISGFAGAGKSLIAIQEINKFIEFILDAYQEQIHYLEQQETTEDEEKQTEIFDTNEDLIQPKQVFYLTNTQRLAQFIKSQWEKTPLANKLKTLRLVETNSAPVEITFGTYEDLHKFIIKNNQRLQKAESSDSSQQQNPPTQSIDEYTFVGFEEFAQWWSQLINQTQRNIFKKLTSTCPDLHNPQLVYWEFKNITRCETLSDYQNLGDRKSLFNPSIRQFLFEKFQNYNSMLEHNRWVDTALVVALSREQAIDLIIADEGQNTSFAEWETISSSVKDNNVLICYGRDQITNNGVSVLEFILEKFNLAENNIIHLSPQNQRSPYVVNQLGHTIRAFTSAIVGGNLEKKLQSQAETQENYVPLEGNIAWITQVNPEIQETLRQESSESAVLVITNPNDMQRAREMFGAKAVIATANEVGGIEHDIVYLYNPLANMREINKIAIELDINSDNLLQKQNLNRTKRDRRENEKYYPTLSLLLTAVTRCLSPGKLVIIQPENRAIARILNILKEEQKQLAYTLTQSSKENTQKLIKQFNEAGLSDRVAQLQATISEQQMPAIADVTLPTNEIKEETKEEIHNNKTGVQASTKSRKHAKKKELLEAQATPANTQSRKTKAGKKGKKTSAINFNIAPEEILQAINLKHPQYDLQKYLLIKECFKNPNNTLLNLLIIITKEQPAILDILEEPQGIIHFYNIFEEKKYLVNFARILFQKIPGLENAYLIHILLSAPCGIPLLALTIAKLQNLSASVTSPVLKEEIYKIFANIYINILLSLFYPTDCNMILIEMLLKDPNRILNEDQAKMFIANEENIDLYTKKLAGKFILSSINKLLSEDREFFNRIQSLSDPQWFTELNRKILFFKLFQLNDINKFESCIDSIICSFITEENLKLLPEGWLLMNPDSKNPNYNFLCFISESPRLYSACKDYIIQHLESIPASVWFQPLNEHTRFCIFTNILNLPNTKEIINHILNKEECLPHINAELIQLCDFGNVYFTSGGYIDVFKKLPHLLEQLPLDYWLNHPNDNKPGVLSWIISHNYHFILENFITFNPEFANILLNNINKFQEIINYYYEDDVDAYEYIWLVKEEILDSGDNLNNLEKIDELNVSQLCMFNNNQEEQSELVESNIENDLNTFPF